MLLLKDIFKMSGFFLDLDAVCITQKQYYLVTNAFFSKNYFQQA